MKIEIWSDIMCPFCYIGKRHLEKALTSFPNEQFQIEWKSFQLDPTVVSQPNKNVYEYLAERKGMSVQESMHLHQSVVESAAKVGLDYHFDKTIIANSRTAHRLIQLAKTKGLGDEMEEIFFKAYFTDGKDLNDADTLIQLSTSAGLSALEVTEVIEIPTQFEQAVQNDLLEAQQIGVRGVPFFVFNRKYAVSGAQPIEQFEATIQTILQEN